MADVDVYLDAPRFMNSIGSVNSTSEVLKTPIALVNHGDIKAYKLSCNFFLISRVFGKLENSFPIFQKVWDRDIEIPAHEYRVNNISTDIKNSRGLQTDTIYLALYCTYFTTPNSGFKSFKKIIVYLPNSLKYGELTSQSQELTNLLKGLNFY